MRFVAGQFGIQNPQLPEAIGHLRTGDEGFLRKRANVLIADDIR